MNYKEKNNLRMPIVNTLAVVQPHWSA